MSSGPDSFDMDGVGAPPLPVSRPHSLSMVGKYLSRCVQFIQKEKRPGFTAYVLLQSGNCATMTVFICKERPKRRILHFEGMTLEIIHTKDAPPRQALWYNPYHRQFQANPFVR